MVTKRDESCRALNTSDQITRVVIAGSSDAVSQSSGAICRNSFYDSNPDHTGKKNEDPPLIASRVSHLLSLPDLWTPSHWVAFLFRLRSTNCVLGPASDSRRALIRA